MTRESQELKALMWEHQAYLRVVLDVYASDLFESLSPKLIPEVTLVGRLVDGVEEGDSICFEPPSSYNSSIFENIEPEISTISKKDEKIFPRLFSSITGEGPRKFTKRKWVRDAILKILQEKDPASRYFCSLPQRVGNYHVAVILRFDKKVYDSFYSLKNDFCSMKTESADFSLKLQRSLIEATVMEFLNEAAEVLQKPNPGQSGGIERARDEVLREAARRLMYTPSWYGGSKRGLYGLYEAANAISLSYYEGCEATGRLLIVRPDHPNVEVVVEFSKPSEIGRARSIRKLLETSCTELALLTDSYKIYGLGYLKGQYNGKSEDLYEIHFTKRHSWNLIHAGNILMQMEDGIPCLPEDTVSKEKTLSDLKRLFPKNAENQNQNLCNLIECAAKQKEGTTIVISGRAAEEAKRLENQSTPIQPVKLTEKLILSLSAIDGAILISPEGICYAIGVVLDGLASPMGDPSRGARYNSAVRYVEANPSSLAVVISKDGSIDFVPDLWPKIPRTIVDEAVKQAKTVLSRQPLDEAKLTELVHWFERHSFYLMEEDCEVANQVLDTLDRFASPNEGKYAEYKRFKKQKEMSNFYYL